MTASRIFESNKAVTFSQSKVETISMKARDIRCAMPDEGTLRQPVRASGLCVAAGGRFVDAAAGYQRALAFPENAASAEVHNAYGVALDPAFQDARINLARIGGK